MANGDTIAVLSTQDGDVANNISWEEYNGTWATMNSSWNNSIALAIFPIMCANANSVDFIENKNEVRIFPNPTTGIVNLIGVENFEQMQIFNIQGKLVKNITSYTNQINMSNLSPGNYILKIISNKTVITKKLIIIN